MNSLIGILIFVILSTLAGTVLGSLFGCLSTLINNLVLSHYFGAALGSYRWWILFHLKIWALGFGILSLLWGLFLVYKGPTIPSTLG